MLEMTTAKPDLAENVLSAHGADFSWQVVLRRNLSLQGVPVSFTQLSRSDGALEACGVPISGAEEASGWAKRYTLSCRPL